MPNNVCFELFTEIDDDLTVPTTAPVVGKTFAAISADLASSLDVTTAAIPATYDTGNFRVATAGAGVKTVGVFAYDQLANATLPIKTGGKVVPVTAGAAITAGQEVQSDAAGRAVPWDGTVASRRSGQAYSGAGAAGADVFVRLYP